MTLLQIGLTVSFIDTLESTYLSIHSMSLKAGGSLHKRHFPLGSSRSKSIGESLSPVLSTMLEMESSLNLVNKNVREDSKDGDLYRAIKAEVTIPENLLSKVYETKYASHFFGKDDILEMIQKWSRPRSINGQQNKD